MVSSLLSHLYRYASDTRNGYFVRLGLLFAACFLALEFASFAYTPPAVLPVQSGVAFAGLVLGGISLWPAIFVAVLAHLILDGNSVQFAVLIGTALSCEALFGAAALRHFRFSRDFPPRHMLMFMGVAVAASFILPAVGIVVERYSGVVVIPVPTSALWTGHLLSIIFFAPFIISMLDRPSTRLDVGRALELMTAFLFLAVVSYVVYFSTISSGEAVALAILVLFPYLWIALRFGVRWTSLALSLASIMAVIGPGLGLVGLLGSLPRGDLIVRREFVLEIMGTMVIMLASITDKQRSDYRELENEKRKVDSAFLQVRAHDREKAEFIAILAHELRNPLQPIMAHLELIKLFEPNPNIAKSAGVIESNVNTMRRLLEDILDVSQVSRRAFILRKVRLAVQEPLRRAIESSRSAREEKRIQLELQLPDDPLVLEGDALRLEQIFTNVLNNAIKFGKSEGLLRVWITKHQREIEVHVKDDGQGISPETLPRIFEPFIQAAEHKEGGLGIGLFLVKRFAEMHGGKVAAKSGGIGQGSEFTITLPISPAKAEAENALEVKSALPPAQRILVVDDVKEQADALSKLLSYYGHSTEVAYSGSEAIEKARSVDPDVIFLDIRMGDIDGYEVAKEMRRQGVEATLIALTGFGQAKDKEKARDAGFDHYMVKPANFNEILDVLMVPSIRKKDPRAGRRP